MARRRSLLGVGFPLLALLTLSLAACDSRSPTEPDPQDILRSLTERVETEHFVFHFSPGDPIDAERQEAHYRWAAGLLGIGLPQKIDYFKYRDRGHIQQLTGRSANGWADPGGFAVHTIFPFHPHESVHVYSSLLGRPSDFFNEGLAVAFSADPLAGDFEPTYDGVTPVHEWARQQMGIGGLVPLDALVTSADFRALDEWTGYQEAGSFVQFLGERYGADLLAAYFSMGRQNDSRERIRQTFASLYGLSLEEAERQWHDFLGGS